MSPPDNLRGAGDPGALVGARLTKPSTAEGPARLILTFFGTPGNVQKQEVQRPLAQAPKAQAQH
jgi:hypothetical protein